MRNFVRSIARLWSSDLGGGMLEDAHAAYRKQDYTTALRLYRQLADACDADAQTTLGYMYNLGQGVPQDYAQAVKWYRLAADRGYAWAQTLLGIMYQAGQGVPQDNAQALKWFNLAAAGASDAHNRERAVKCRDQLARMMTPAQIVEALRMSRDWRPK